MLNTLPNEFRNLGVIRDDLFYARVTTQTWKEILLSELDTPIIAGHMRQLVGKKVGPGVYEIRLAPLPDETPDKAQIVRDEELP